MGTGLWRKLRKGSWRSLLSLVNPRSGEMVLVTVQWWKRLFVLGFWTGAVLGQMLGTASMGGLHRPQLGQRVPTVPQVSPGHGASQGDEGTSAGSVRAAPRSVPHAGKAAWWLGWRGQEGTCRSRSLPELKDDGFWVQLGCGCGAWQRVFAAHVAVLVQVSPSDPRGPLPTGIIASLPLFFRDPQM